jgi:hypothetical protein
METKPWLDLVSQFKLKTVKEGEDTVARGRLGELFQRDDEHVGAMYMPPRVRKGWLNFRKRMEAVGAEAVQVGDTEGVVSFLFDNHKAVRAACSLLGIKNKRSVSPEKRAILAQRLATYRASLHA